MENSIAVVSTSFLLRRTFPTHLHSKADNADALIRAGIPLWFLYSLESSSSSSARVPAVANFY